MQQKSFIFTQSYENKMTYYKCMNRTPRTHRTRHTKKAHFEFIH